jgi:hypothetical protein
MIPSMCCKIGQIGNITTCARERGIEGYRNGTEKYLELARIKLARRWY